ncbi:uncharacterized membrane protein YcaP (DUF421 family) [Oikeobacillus pervagus]|uniref:Uncharacterized membrane protein YcaP (DUF421 family) n=1 Tax=Oikeobacillus pervagus TaxID=1325931 RepID=A0AAJ1T1U7_9BACI|nr:DUF421 domain-containing protein [Oikeobacillus pervagus]MDQ0215637.1 uncharacterized membrane protein YcaP (DUF421 family) [Oikeobacillus pervagus]
MNLWSIAADLAVGYVALFALTKFLGKTQIAQLSPFDFVSAVTLGELVGNSIYDKEISTIKMLFAVIIWGALIFITEIATQKSRKFRHFSEGKPAIIINKGKIDYQELKKNRLDMNQMQHLLRSKDVFSVRECEYALLETDGTLSVLKKPLYDEVTKQDLNLIHTPNEGVLPLTVILDKEIIYDNLKIIDKDESWLRSEMEKAGIKHSEEVLYAEWTEGQNLFIQTFDKRISS